MDKEKQKTIEKPVSYSGIGLHTGNKTTVTFKPAPPNTGIHFLRTDLASMPVIEASIENVVGLSRGTTIGKDGNSIHTVEHIMAALCGVGIDNLIIEIDSNEPPVGDGSSSPYVEVLKKAGIQEQDEAREYFIVTKPIKYDVDGVCLVVLPDTKFRISCIINYDHPILRTQYASYAITNEVFEKDIAPARTYCFDTEVQTLKEQGLIKGGSMENAVVVGEKGLYNAKLRFPDEFVRHKIMDLMGDIYLLGKPLKAHIIGIRCGHASNIALTKKMKKILDELVISRNEIIKDRKEFKGTELDTEAIKRIIPHRPPFLLVDRVVVSEGEGKALGYKKVSPDEDYFKGHFPSFPIMPGVLIVESMAQTACVLFLSRPQVKNMLPYFIMIEDVKFRKPVFPNSELFLEVEVLRARSIGGKVRGRAYVNDELVAEAEFMFSLVVRENSDRGK